MSLSLSPGTWPYFTQLDPFQVPAWLTPVPLTNPFTGSPRAPASAVAQLLPEKLPGLQHLEMANDTEFAQDFFSALRRMSHLTSLDLLSGAPVCGRALQVRRAPIAPLTRAHGSAAVGNLLARVRDTPAVLAPACPHDA